MRCSTTELTARSYSSLAEKLAEQSGEAPSIAGVIIGKSPPTISRKLVGVGAASQRSIPTGEPSLFVDAHRGDGKRFIVRADEKLTAFFELEAAIRASNGHDRAAAPV